ncbi:DUF4192 domain-containing protein [Nakamurella antarctica]|uniref:DUF4192 domain-containing protein n=1 Tax=Nakamurella antarctica TaxID=1902245 RepID=A0A3G8ZLD5_9ACTN|nr:DUF4192 domain-containing protein [Nakamurella antarctica]AZI58139.1 DUF4192 domain-containing protein [Nakamurella antarctica]
MTTSSTHTDVVRVSGAEGVIASVPYLLGFHPRESLVLLCMRNPRNRIGPVMRIDLPAPDAPREERSALASYVALQARAHADSVVLICYTDGEDTGPVSRRRFAQHALMQDCRRAIKGAGIRVFDLYLVREKTSLSYQQHRPGTPGYPLLAESNSEIAKLSSAHACAGRRVLADRDALRTSIAGPVGGIAQDAVDQIARAQSRRVDHAARSPHASRAPANTENLSTKLHQARSLRVAGDPLGEELIADLVVAFDDPLLRDQAIYWALKNHDESVVALFVDLAVWTPSTACAQTCAVLAVVAYRAGDGALAQVALDRVFAADPHHRLGGLLLATMQAGIEPRHLDGMLLDQQFVCDREESE